MSARSVTRSKKSASSTGKRKRIPTPRRGAPAVSTWTAWWPLLAAIAITVVAVKTAEILPLMGPAGLLKLKLLYPFALLLKQPQFGLAEQDSERWSQWVLYGQWILYGLYASLAIHWTSRRRALLQLIAFHAAGFCVLWSLSAS